jgi:hypothetical protein
VSTFSLRCPSYGNSSEVNRLESALARLLQSGEGLPFSSSVLYFIRICFLLFVFLSSSFFSLPPCSPRFFTSTLFTTMVMVFGVPLARRIKAMNVYHEKNPQPASLTLFGGVLTILTPLAIIGYGIALIVLFVNRPVVVVTSLESALFTFPSVTMNCSCAVGSTCSLSFTFIPGSSVSDGCVARSNGLAGNFTGLRVVNLCYSTRSSEGTVVFVPSQCTLSTSLESIADVAFNFSNPQGRKRSVSKVVC